MNSRVLTIVGLSAAIVIAACVDLAAPKGAPASISQVQLGAFYVVQGDTMRDTLGTAVPPSIIAYDAAGNALTTFTPTFFITDTVQSLHFNPDGSLIANGPADTVGATAHLIGQIGSLQTAVQTIYITVRPDTLERVTTTALDSVVVPVTGDSASSIGTVSLSTVVHGVGGRVVPGVFVRYTLATTIASNSASPVAYLRDDANTTFLVNQSTPDTGDASGTTSRTLVVNSKMVNDRSILFSTTVTDTLVVLATAKYKGLPLTNAPLRILVPVRFK